MWLVYLVLVSVWRSARQVEAELADPRVWRFMRHTVKGMFPEEPSMWLADRPMRRHHYLYGRRYLTDPAILEKIRQIHSGEAVKLARHIGLLDPQGPGSQTHPDLSRMLYGDGKVITPLYRAEPTTCGWTS